MNQQLAWLSRFPDSLPPMSDLLWVVCLLVLLVLVVAVVGMMIYVWTAHAPLQKAATRTKQAVTAVTVTDLRRQVQALEARVTTLEAR